MISDIACTTMCNNTKTLMYKEDTEFCVAGPSTLHKILVAGVSREAPGSKGNSHEDGFPLPPQCLYRGPEVVFLQPIHTHHLSVAIQDRADSP